MKGRIGLLGGAVVLSVLIWAQPAAALRVASDTKSSGGAPSVVNKVTCPAGTHVVSGGGNVDPSGYIYQSKKAGNGWQIGGETEDALGTTATVFALCSRRDWKIFRRADEERDRFPQPVARCPRGSRVVSGGGFTSLSGSFLSLTAKRGRRGWAVSGFAPTPVTVNAEAYAYCTRRALSLVTASAVSAANESSSGAVAECPAGTELFSGGARATSGWLFGMQPSPPQFAVTSQAIGGASATDAFAYCKS